jgi:hypothetical protein
MDPEKLLGGYAAGTLTEAERKVLFETALQDQTLFNALADEQVFKELLDDPASRRRLIERLEQAERLEQTGAVVPRAGGRGLLDPAWLQPSRDHEARASATRAERLYAASGPPQPPRRPTRWALAGSLVVAVLAVFVSLQLYEEAETPPQPEPADAERAADSMPAPAPAPAAPTKPPAGAPAPSAPSVQAPPTPQPRPLLREDQASRSAVAQPRLSARELFYGRPAAPPLGLRYSLVKETGADGEAEVSPATVFSAGDMLRLSLEVTRPGYLYVVKRSPLGSWTLLFPAPGPPPDPGGGAAYVKEGTRYVVPSQGSLIGAEARGPADLFIILAREPHPELADPTDPGRVTDLVKRVRSELAGGRLLVQRVDPSQPDIPGEHAVYVIDQDPSGRRILAEVMLSPH